MVPHKLRIAYGTNDSLAPEVAPAARMSVSVRLEEVFPVMLEALAGNLAWLEDFADDKIAISSDLYEVLLAHQHHRAVA